jgi:dTDP-4-dehydrorhamnose 3,5-epimerase
VIEGVRAKKLIDGVKVKKLRVLPDERGRLTEMLRNDDDLYIKFGQLYMTTGYPGVVKGWHYHKKQIDNFIAVKGMLKVVLFDGRENSPTRGEVNEFFVASTDHPPDPHLRAARLQDDLGDGSHPRQLPHGSAQLRGPDEFRVHPRQ